ncbi:MAG: hypothetical protein CMP52_05700 [Flavobacteriales bacterium]|nr:hypothetical protein [Candidatus Arcticimaribacter sp.]
MKKYYMILLVLLSACSADPVEPEVPVEEIVEPEVVVIDYDSDPIYSKGRPNLLNSYWNIFKESAALYDIDLSYIEEVNFVSTDLPGNVAGRADGSCEDYVRILIDETTFRNLETGEQIFLMYHELGHDVFNASHDGGGLMAPNIRSIEYTLFQTEVRDFFTKVDFVEWTDEECEIIRGFTDD